MVTYTASDSADDPADDDDGGLQSSTSDELASISAAHGPTRAALIDAFVAARMDVFRRFAVSFVRRHGIHPDAREDIAQIVAEAAYIMVSEVGEGVVLPVNWEGLLYARAKGKVRSYVESGAYTPASGMTSRSRRAAKLAYTRSRLQTETGREPSTAEVVRAWNVEARSRYADAVRQGMIATEADLLPVTSRDIDNTTVVAFDLRDDFVLHPAESATFVSAVIGRCQSVSRAAAEVAAAAARAGCRVPSGTQEDLRLGEVATLWLGSAVSDVPFIRVPAEVAEEMGVSYEVARRGTSRVREIAMDILRNGYDIHGA